MFTGVMILVGMKDQQLGATSDGQSEIQLANNTVLATADTTHKNNQKSRFRTIVSEVLLLIRREPYIIMGIFGDICGRFVAVTCSTYTSFAVTDAFAN